MITSVIFCVCNILFSSLAENIYDAHPYAWYQAFPHIDFMLIGFSFIFLSMNYYNKVRHLFLEYHFQFGNYKFMLISILFQLAFTVYSLTQLPPPYILAFISIIAIHVLQHLKLRTSIVE